MAGEMTLLETFCAEVESYLKKTEVRPTAFGVAAVGDPSFVFDIREGRQPRLGMVDRVTTFIRENPRGLPASEEA